MKTIIIPVKFNLGSGSLLQSVVSLYEKQETNVVLLEVREIPSSYTELLTLPKVEQKQYLIDAYKNYAALLNKTYGTSIAITTDFLYGDSPAVFRNYVQFKDASLVIYAENEWHDSANSINIFRMVKRSGTELMYIAGEPVVSTEGADVYTYKRQSNNSDTPASRRVRKEAPETVMHQFNAVDNLLDGLHEQYFQNKILSKKISNLSRYFLKEASLHNMLEKSNCSVVLLRR